MSGFPALFLPGVEDCIIPRVQWGAEWGSIHSTSFICPDGRWHPLGCCVLSGSYEWWSLHMHISWDPYGHTLLQPHSPSVVAGPLPGNETPLGPPHYLVKCVPSLSILGEGNSWRLSERLCLLHTYHLPCSALTVIGDAQEAALHKAVQFLTHIDIHMDFEQLEH